MMLGDYTENSSIVTDNMAAMEDNKLNIEETTLNLSSIKKELDEEMIDYEEISGVKRLKTDPAGNVIGESSYKIELKEEGDNLIDYPENVVTESEFVTLRSVKEEEEDENSDYFYCNRCNGNYDGYCLKCSTLSHILNNRVRFTYSQSEVNTTPSDILEIKETSIGKGVFLIKTLPKNVIFGPFEGILGIESTGGHSWKIKNRKLLNIENSNWMKDIACAVNALFKNLDIFQFGGNLYYKTNREIIEGEELLVYYDEQEIQKLENSDECYLIPEKQEKLPSIFACTLCCLGFSADKCLIEHKSKCPYTEQSRNLEDIELIECHSCKIWLEKEEYREHHIPYCKESQHRIWNYYSEADDRTQATVGEIDDPLMTKNRELQTNYKHNFQIHLNGHKSIKPFQCYVCEKKFTAKSYLKMHIKNKHPGNVIEKNFHTNGKQKLQFDMKPFACGICSRKFGHKNYLKIHIKNKHVENESEKDYKCSDCSYQTNYKTGLQQHVIIHRDIKRFQCDFCPMKFRQKIHLKLHLDNKHAENSNDKNYKCSECSFQTNYKHNLKDHLVIHSGIKPFQCDVCMAKFSRKDHLKEHAENKHGKNAIEKKFKCSECSFQTNYHGHFQMHLNGHKGIKPFQCDICWKKFAQKANLKIHMKNRHTEASTAKDYKCSQCSFETNYKRNYQAHLNVHSNVKPFQCDVCMLRFTEKNNFKKHLKNKHAKN